MNQIFADTTFGDFSSVLSSSFPGCSRVVTQITNLNTLNTLVHFDQMHPENGCISSHHGFAVC